MEPIIMTNKKTLPHREGLYVPEMEKDSCGTGLLANLNGIPTHQLVEDALLMLRNMEHRGACGSEPNTGDGAGILLQTPHRLFEEDMRRLGFPLPEFGSYGVGMLFLPKDEKLKQRCLDGLRDCINWLNFRLIGYRNVPVDHSGLGDSAIAAEPDMVQVFVRHKDGLTKIELERKLFLLRNYATREVHRILSPEARDLFYFASFSYKTIVYKGQLTTWQLQSYFLDLQDERLESAIALIHSRFSTNTVPKWRLAQPFRYIAHNGEINTLTGNLNWWKSRETSIHTELYSEEELSQLKPVCPEGQSDSGYFDNVLEMMVMGDRSLPHSMMMMIPEAWELDEQMEDYKKAFYEYHENLMEPWDGPASICFTNGILVGATLDRNGLRPSRYCLTEDNMLILASEAGALPVEPSKIVMKGRLQPGRMLIADLDEQRIIGDEEVKKIICKRLPYRDWLEKYRLKLQDFSPSTKEAPQALSPEELLHCQRTFGYTREDLKIILEPMTVTGDEPLGSMGVDTPLAVLSSKPQHLSHYFKQLFAQVTNPPIDPIRERLVMSLSTRLGGGGNFLAMTLEHARFLRLDQPVLDHEEFQKIKHIWHPHYRAASLDLQFKADGKPDRLRSALNKLCRKAEELVKEGVNILILSDRQIPNPQSPNPQSPIPTLLATGAVHHHLIHMGLRGKTSIVVEAGDAWETHHFAALIGFGANAVHPWLALATVTPPDPRRDSSAAYNYRKAIQKGLLKIMSKNGISTLQSYHGAQIFEILGLNSDVVDNCFTGAISRIEGMGFDEIAKEILQRTASPSSSLIPHPSSLPAGGNYQWKADGEAHNFNPQSIHLLQFSTRKNDYAAFKKYAALINRESGEAVTLRSLLKFKKTTPIPLEEVEPVEAILKRFASGAMSFGSISHEAHSTLAIAMNRIGAKSNSGEGGEDPIRFEQKTNGDWERSAIKQVASGRFGVTSHYLSNADELQIKMAQGAKPGEGGQLPGHKVDEWIARVRHSTPGVGLISPPPHHDIYSIEDLAQLIFDLKNANRAARISVKLVSKAGVGVIASGVAKAHADAILISGHDGGTGASPLTSIRHAGLPWELGVAEAHQTLVRNKLRDRVVLQADGQIRTGRDVAIATLLGAEEWSVATAALVVQGCIMMRKCHLNTCPVGIATQDPELRLRFDADPQYVVNFFTFLAQDFREIMAELGFRTVKEMVGRCDLLETSAVSHAQSVANSTKLARLDLSPLLFREPGGESVGQFKAVEQDHGIEDILDWTLLQKAGNALDYRSRVQSNFAIRNTDRATGTLLSNEITKRYGAQGLSDGALHFGFRGSAGQSFGAFAVRGIHFVLEGESNDYFGKGLSGGRLIVMPDREAKFDPSENIIIGNVALYGATSGEVFIRGRAGERFAVRNSGAKAVTEGVGDHGCEYMTGGVVVVLGNTGKNFAAGMSGGMAFIYDADRSFEIQANLEMADLDPLDAEDFELLRRLVRDHFRYTGSRAAHDILQNWQQHRRRFVKVMPKDLKAVLEAKAVKAQIAKLAEVPEPVSG